MKRKGGLDWIGHVIVDQIMLEFILRSCPLVSVTVFLPLVLLLMFVLWLCIRESYV